MSTDNVRNSRDGDQFHYYWAAQQSLHLLRPRTRIGALVVEGHSKDDTDGADGSEVIDLAEYWGSSDLSRTERAIYRQFKHTTVQSEKPWTASFLKKTLVGFAKKIAAISRERPEALDRVYFEFVTNRPCAPTVPAALSELARGEEPTSKEAKYLQGIVADLIDAESSTFLFQRLTVDDKSPSLLPLRDSVVSNIASYLPGTAGEEVLLLTQMVSDRANSIMGASPEITKATVLRALRVTEDQLLPAPSQLRSPDLLIEIEQMSSAVKTVVVSSDRPVIVHAAGGMGKSVFASQLGAHLPGGSLCVTYDCFANGSYRRSSGYRHEHHQALLQLINELAAEGLCQPALPSPTARSDDYMRIFLDRVQTSARALKGTSDTALLVLAIDAADNAVLVADETGTRSFVGDLLRESLPDNARLVVLCRTERIDMLDPPPSTARIQLGGFTLHQTKHLLEARYGEVALADVSEFHNRTGGNPRIQSFVLDAESELDAALRRLGESFHTDSAILEDLLAKRVDEIRDLHREVRSGVERLFRSFATLRPQMPIGALATICGLDPSHIKSVAADFGHQLLVDDDTIQFRDEPTETWFRENLRPTGEELDEFVDVLVPFATAEPYVAASLPQLLYEAERVDDLVQLAMGDSALPAGSDTTRLEIAQLRAQFALKACLRAERLPDAGRLAIRAGSLEAGNTRRLTLFRKNADLASRFLSPDVIEGLVATRALEGDWPGSRLHVEGSLLSGAPGHLAFARSRLRSAQDWVYEWVNGGDDHPVTDADISEIAFGILNVDGTETSLTYLSRWTPDDTLFRSGLILGRRLVDANRIAELQDFIRLAVKNKYIQLALMQAAYESLTVVSRDSVAKVIAMLKRHKNPIDLREERHQWPRQDLFGGILWAITLGIRSDLLTHAEALRILNLYIPASFDHSAGDVYHIERWLPYLHGYALRSHLDRSEIDLEKLASPDIQRERERRPHANSLREFEYLENTKPLLPLVRLLVDVTTLENTPSVTARLTEQANLALTTYVNHREPPRGRINASARLLARILKFQDHAETAKQLSGWLFGHSKVLSPKTFVDIARVCAPHEHTASLAVAAASIIGDSVQSSQESADERVNDLVAITRAVLPLGIDEARPYFDLAVAVTDHIGDDIFDRWNAFETIAVHTADERFPDPQRAHRLSQVAEGLGPYLGDGMPSEAVVKTIATLDPVTAFATAGRWRDRRFARVDSLTTGLISPDGLFATQNTFSALGLCSFLMHIPSGLVEHARNHVPSGQADLMEATITQFRRQRPEPNQQQPSTGSRRWLANDESEHPPSNEDFSRFDLRSSSGWDAAFKFCDSSDRSRQADANLLAWAAHRPAAELRATIQALGDASVVKAWHIELFFSQLEDSSFLSIPVRTEIRKLSLSAARRFCREIVLKKYNPINFSRVAELTNLTSSNYIHSSIIAAGSLPGSMSSEECFALAASIAGSLEYRQVQAIFDEFAQLFEDVAPLDSGAGAFKTGGSHPITIHQSVAGFIWSALADPVPATRWQAAHAVLQWLTLGVTKEIDALVDFAEGRLSHVPFTDPVLHFYHLHALQWLLFAVDRASASVTVPILVTKFVPLLERALSVDRPHAVMRHSAKRALLNLHRAGIAILTPEQLNALHQQIRTQQGIDGPKVDSRTVTLSGLQALSDDEERGTSRRSATNSAHTATRFKFFMDFEDYWCEELGRAFGVTNSRIAQLVDEVLIDRWQVASRGSAEDDARFELGFYNGRSFSNKYEWPEEEDLDFYLCTHALCEVAESLVAYLPVIQAYAHCNEYEDWLQRFTTNREDGRWLADRRDAPPANVWHDYQQHASSEVTQDWLEISDSFFDSQLIPSAGHVTVGGSWTERWSDRWQTVSVQSALASPETSEALLVALQTNPEPWAFRLPEYGDDETTFDFEPYSLSGWIDTGSRHEGRDRSDPYAGEISYPPPRPSEPLQRAFDLTPDADMREWRHRDKIIAESFSWNTYTNSSTRELGTDGFRIDWRSSGIDSLLSRLGRHLIVEVLIRRTIDSKVQGEDERSPFRPQSRYYLFSQEGRSFTA